MSIREGPSRGSSGVGVQKPRRREASQEVEPVHTFVYLTQERTIHRLATTAQQTLWKGDVWNGNTNVEKITSVRAQQLDERASAWRWAIDGWTDTHGTVREELCHDVGAGGTVAPADAAFFLPFFFPFPLPFAFGLGLIARRIDGTRWRHGRRRRAPRLAPPLQSSFAQVELTFLLVFTGNPPSPVRNAVASSKAGNEACLIGPIDPHSVNKALDDESHVLQAGV